MDLQLPNIGKTMTNNILPSILSTDTLSIWISLGKFREIPSMYRQAKVSCFRHRWPVSSMRIVNVIATHRPPVVSVNFRIWSKYVG